MGDHQEEPKNREYLGDSVYVRSDGSLLCLTTENGSSVQDTIYLEKFVFLALVNYAKRVKFTFASELVGV